MGNQVRSLDASHRLPRGRGAHGAVRMGLLFLTLLGLAGCTTSMDEPSELPVADPTDVGNVREHDYAVALAECMVDKGWDVKADGVGGWGVTYDRPPEAQRAPMEADFVECRAEAGSLTRGTPEEEANFAYDNIARVVSCLEDLGLETPPAPDRGRFIQLMLSDHEEVIWHPYEFVPADRMREAVLACPQ